jgi:hypothetical protein
LSTWNEADLEARLCRALDVARKTLNYFAIDGYSDKESPVYSFGPEKPVTETAMLIYAASASGNRPNVASRVDELARLLAPMPAPNVCLSISPSIQRSRSNSQYLTFC